MNLEYIWIDGREGTPQLRSKTKVVYSEESIPDWGFDGGSTYQGTLQDSDRILKSVRVYADPFGANTDKLVLCEVYYPDGTPHESNTRHSLSKKDVKELDPWFGFEQEYTLINPDTRKPIGFKDKDPNTVIQGDFYCSIGTSKAIGREIAEAHLGYCRLAGVALDGMNAEVMTGFTGFVDHDTLDANGRFTINLPALDSAPLVFASICGHEGIGGTPGNWTNASCNVYRWTTSSSKYTAVQMQVINYSNDLNTSGSTNGTITSISVANPTVITTTYNMPDNRSIWISGSNSTPVVDGLYYVSNKAGSSPYTYTLNTFNAAVFPVNVTSVGSAGTFITQGHYHEFDQAVSLDYSDDAPAIGIMYMVIYNSGKNIDGLNSHFSQNHTNHG